jgi:trehalose/maltose hydrolase-like predicted phosphorylase
LLQDQINAWAKFGKCQTSLLKEIKAQQGIRFNIFQLNQTYLGKDSRLNIGPKGFTVKNMVDRPIGILRLIVFHFIWLKK